MVQLYIGDGKGKTSAAVGAAVRYSMAFGSDKVWFFQFLKNGESSEVSGLKKLGILTESDPIYQGFVNKIGAETSDKYRTLLRNLIEKTSDYSMIILDEIADMYSLGVFTAEDFEELACCAAENDCELVFTGHQYKGVDIKPLLRICDYVTIMKKEKHPFDLNVKARNGIEF